jgi:putative transposase
MENGVSYPEKAVITTAKELVRGQLEIMVDDKECMYVFDRGYLDYERFDRMTATFSYQDYVKTQSYEKSTILNYPRIRRF